MRYLFLFLALGLMGLIQPSAQTKSVPLPMSTLSDGQITAEIYFSAILQGHAGLVRLQGDITEARAYFLNREFVFMAAENGWYSLLVANIDTQPRLYPLLIVARLANGNIGTVETLITVNSAGFIRQNFVVPNAIAYLTDPEVERDEFARLDAVMSSPSTSPLWSVTGFASPIEAEVTSGFGQYRILNENVQTRHTGIDQRAVIGTPVGAIADGVVVFADRLAIRGNYILMEHGWGVYSGYAHLSQINVERGQNIQQGQIIGLTGNTGRSQGPHLHWEIAVQGEWVDGAEFLRLWLPIFP